MKRFKTKVCCVWLAMWMGHLHAASVDEVRGALLFNLSKVVTFPTANSSTLNLCVYPESRGIIEFFKIKGALQSQGKPFHLKVLSNDQLPTAEFCQMLYLEWPFTQNNKAQLMDWSNNIMTISNDPEFLLSGGLMTLTTAENRMVIMMNKDSLKQSAVTFPSRVLKLATWYP